MNDPIYLHCEPICTDGAGLLNQVERLPDGRLFTMACFAKSSTGFRISKWPQTQFLMGRVSEDEGKTWKSPTFVYEFPDKIAMNQLGEFLIDRDGRIHAFFLHIYNIDTNIKDTKGDITYLRLDNEKGENPLYKKIDCLDRYTGSLNNLLQMSSGRIIVPFSTLGGVKGSAFVSSVIYSDDGGDTWNASNDVSVCSDETHIESGAVEPVIVEAAPGVLVMLIRTVLNRIWYSVSYDEGVTWTQAKPTLIPASNAPSVPFRLQDGRILLSWNDVLGEPMTSVQYSFARQCLHAAVSPDGLKTLYGARIIGRKRAADTDNLQICYPFASPAEDGKVFLRPIHLDAGYNIWAENPATLLKLDPDDLMETEMSDHFEEWITDCDMDENGIRLKATKDGVAYACVNFPYSTEGEIVLKSMHENRPKGAKLIFADSYLDRMTFLPEKRNNGYSDEIKKLYIEAELPGGNEWKISWKEHSMRITGGVAESEIDLSKWGRGFNHMIALFEGDGEMKLNAFTMKSFRGGMKTGIEY